VFPATSVDHFSDKTRILRSFVNTSLAFFATKKAAKNFKTQRFTDKSHDIGILNFNLQ